MSLAPYKLHKWLLLFPFITLACLDGETKKPSQKISAKGNGIAVVELFTSEGCSSCPPADELIKKLQAENKKDVYFLTYHVDYWNRLGWKDVFSKPEFSDRQKQYSRYLSLDGVYTPQIVVNGTDQFVGSNETRLRSLLTRTIQESNLTIEASKPTNAAIHCSYKISYDKPVLLNIVLVQPEATTSVKRGENGGRTLHHVNIVRQLTTVEVTSNSGSIDIDIPKEFQDLQLKVIAYTQQKKGFKITGAAQVEMLALNIDNTIK